MQNMWMKAMLASAFDKQSMTTKVSKTPTGNPVGPG
jgi:hypothetical protein